MCLDKILLNNSILNSLYKSITTMQFINKVEKHSWVEESIWFYLLCLEEKKLLFSY